MNKVILMLTLLFLFANMYYFFLQKNLFLGSITLILSIIFSLIYAMTGRVNKIDIEEK